MPQPLSTWGNNDVTDRVTRPVPVDLRPENILHFFSAVIDEPAILATRNGITSDSAPIKLSILMCAYNEERTIIQAINEVLAASYPCDIELIIVDDGSTDATPRLLTHIDDPRAIIHHHPRNQGKGAALLSAVSLANGTHILPFDADLEYSPDDIPRVIYPVLKGRCDVVYGARIFGFNTMYRSYRYAIGNRLLTRMANILFNAYLSDLHTCLKLMPLAMFRSLNPSESGFGLDTEVTALLLKAGVRPFEVPVSYYSRTHDEGKKISWRDAIACMAILLKVRLLHSPNRKTITASPEGIEQVSVAPESAGAGWRAVRALGVRDDGQPNTVTS